MASQYFFYMHKICWHGAHELCYRYETHELWVDMCYESYSYVDISWKPDVQLCTFTQLIFSLWAPWLTQSFCAMLVCLMPTCIPLWSTLWCEMWHQMWKGRSLHPHPLIWHWSACLWRNQTNLWWRKLQQDPSSLWWQVWTSVLMDPTGEMPISSINSWNSQSG